MVAKKSLMVLSISLILLISMSFISASWFSDLFTGGATNRIGAAGAVVPTRFGAGPSVPTKPIIANRISFSNNGASTISCPTGWSSTSKLGGGSCCVPSGYTGGTPKGCVSTQSYKCCTDDGSSCGDIVLRDGCCSDGTVGTALCTKCGENQKCQNF